MKYLEKLTDPRWKRKALKIIKRDGYKCTVCGGKNKLEVHHTFYYDDYPDPWIYPDESLLTVCRKCHKEHHEFNEIEIKPSLLRKQKRIPVSNIKKYKKKKSRKRSKRIKKEKIICLAEIQSIRGVRIKQRNLR
jgi:hypothetical protein